MKHQNSKFDGFAHALIAESIKRWANTNKFVADKLLERLKRPVDELDSQIADIILTGHGQLDLKPLPKEYEYHTGFAEIRTGKKV